MTTDELLTSTQAGHLIGCSSRTILRAVEAGQIPVAAQLPGPNGPMLFRRSDVEALGLKRAKATA